MTGLKSLLAGSATLMLVTVTVGAHAQDQQLSEQEVEAFLEQTEQSMTQAVQNADFDKVLDWTENRIAEDANFSMALEIFAGDERKGFTSLSLSKEDLVKLGGISAGVLSGMKKDAIEDYSLEIEMTDFTPIGPNAAFVQTKMTERGRIAFPEKDSGETAGAPDSASSAQSSTADTRPRGQAGGQAAEMEGTVQCSHIIQRSEGSQDLQMGLTNCKGEARIGMN